MPTKGLDEWNKYMGMLKLLIQNYDRVIEIINGKDDFELYKQILADDKKIREVIK